MKFAILYSALILFSTIASAQKLDISYGASFGLNSSFMDSKAAIDYSYPFSELDKNIKLTKSTKIDAGYNLGVFFHMRPVNSRFSLESEVLISKYNNTHTLIVNYDRYYSTPWRTPVDNWIPESEIRILQNVFSIIKIPLDIGYDLIQKDKFSLGLSGGISCNLSMKNNNVGYDINLVAHNVYKTFYIGYRAGIITNFNKIVCTLMYERSQNIQIIESRYLFPWEMKVEELHLNSINFSVGYKLNK